MEFRIKNLPHRFDFWWARAAQLPLLPWATFKVERVCPWYLPKLPFRDWVLLWTVALSAGVRLFFPSLSPFLAELLEFSHHIIICWKASYSMRTDNISESPGFWLPCPSAPWLKLLFAIWTVLAIINFLGHSELGPCAMYFQFALIRDSFCICAVYSGPISPALMSTLLHTDLDWESLHVLVKPKGSYYQASPPSPIPLPRLKNKKTKKRKHDKIPLSPLNFACNSTYHSF